MPFDLASYIDHTLLQQVVRMGEIEQLCREAVEMQFAAVCIPSQYVRDSKRLLQGSRVNVATVVGFPLGFGSKAAKAGEIRAALADGADEVDMVIDLCALRNGNLQALKEEIQACLEPVKAQGKVIKVIVESGILSEEELLTCCGIYGKYDIDYLKTSTGYAAVGATVAAVKQMRANLPKQMGIKAAGGIRTYEFAKELIDAGATRLGCSASMEVVRGVIG